MQGTRLGPAGNIANGDGTAPENRHRIHVITGSADEVARRVKPR